MLKNNESYLPLFLHKITMREIAESEILLSKERAEEIALRELQKRINGAKITKTEQEEILTENELILNCEVTLQKNIAVSEKILFSTINY